MVKRSLGKLSKRSRLLRRRTRVVTSVASTLEQFEKGQRVHVTPISTRSMPHPRYRGKTGTVVGMQGGAYVVELQDHRATKRLVIEGAHLTRAR